MSACVRCGFDPDCNVVARVDGETVIDLYDAWLADGEQIVGDAVRFICVECKGTAERSKPLIENCIEKGDLSHGMDIEE